MTERALPDYAREIDDATRYVASHRDQYPDTREEQLRYGYGEELAARMRRKAKEQKP